MRACSSFIGGRMRSLRMEPLEHRQMLSVTLNPIGTYSSGVFDDSAAEIVAHDPATQRLFVTNASEGTVDMLDMSDPTVPTLIGQIDATPFGVAPTSAAVSDGVLAVAVRNDPGVAEGNVVFFDTSGNLLGSVVVGFGPDMLTFTPDGTKVLVANSGKPTEDYLVDPMGTISIIDVSGGVTGAPVNTADFTQYDGQGEMLRDKEVRVFGPVVEMVDGEPTIVGTAAPSVDLEPEYIAVSPDSSTAWITLQANNAMATLDVDSGEIVDVKGFGYKNHRAAGNGLDGCDKDDGINIKRWRVKGMYQPDGVAAYATEDGVFLLTANEGGARNDYPGVFEEDVRLEKANVVKGLQSLQDRSAIGRLDVSTTPPHGARVNKDGQIVLNQLYSFGARSFSIWDENVDLVYDSGDDFEQVTAAALPEHFNANDANKFDDGNPDNFETRSDNKGPEPESVVTGEVDGRTYAFVGLERIGGIMVYDVTDPQAPVFQSYMNNRNFLEPNEIPPDSDITNPAVGDLAVEGLAFVSAADSPIPGQALLVTANEVSGTTTVFAVGQSTTPSVPATSNTNFTAEDWAAVVDQILAESTGKKSARPAGRGVDRLLALGMLDE